MEKILHGTSLEAARAAVIDLRAQFGTNADETTAIGDTLSKLRQQQNELQRAAAHGADVTAELSGARREIAEVEARLEELRAIRGHIQAASSEATQRLQGLEVDAQRAQAEAILDSALNIVARLNATFRNAESLWSDIAAKVDEAAALGASRPRWLPDAVEELRAHSRTDSHARRLELPTIGTRRRR